MRCPTYLAPFITAPSHTHKLIFSFLILPHLSRCFFMCCCPSSINCFYVFLMLLRFSSKHTFFFMLFWHFQNSKHTLYPDEIYDNQQHGVVRLYYVRYVVIGCLHFHVKGRHSILSVLFHRRRLSLLSPCMFLLWRESCLGFSLENG